MHPFLSFEDREVLKAKIKNELIGQEPNNIRRLVLTQSVDDLDSLLALVEEIKVEIQQEYPDLLWDFAITANAKASSLTIFKGTSEETQRIYDLVAAYQEIMKNKNAPIPFINERDSFIIQYLLYLR